MSVKFVFFKYGPFEVFSHLHINGDFSSFFFRNGLRLRLYWCFDKCCDPGFILRGEIVSDKIAFKVPPFVFCIEEYPSHVLFFFI